MESVCHVSWKECICIKVCLWCVDPSLEKSAMVVGPVCKIQRTCRHGVHKSTPTTWSMTRVEEDQSSPKLRVLACSECERPDEAAAKTRSGQKSFCVGCMGRVASRRNTKTILVFSITSCIKHVGFKPCVGRSLLCKRSSCRMSGPCMSCTASCWVSSPDVLTHQFDLSEKIAEAGCGVP